MEKIVIQPPSATDSSPEAITQRLERIEAALLDFAEHLHPDLYKKVSRTITGNMVLYGNDNWCIEGDEQ